MIHPREQLIRDLCSPECAGRRSGTPGGRAARGLVVRAMREAGLDPFEQAVEGCGGANVLAKIPGDDPRWVVVGGAVLISSAWILNSMASSLTVLYIGAALGGIGTGCVYGTCVGNALKWFPGRRGLAAGITAAGFGAGAAVTIIPISNMIRTAGYEQAFLFFGTLQGVIVLVMSALMRKAPPQLSAGAKVKASLSARDYSPGEIGRAHV